MKICFRVSAVRHSGMARQTFGHFIILGISNFGIVLPAFLGSMIVAVIVRNFLALSHHRQLLLQIN